MKTALVPLRRIATPRVEPSSGVRPCVTLDMVESGRARLLTDPEPTDPDGQLSFEPGDVLFSKLRPYLAKSLLVEEPMHGTGEFIVMRPHPDVLDPRYLCHLTISAPWLDHAQSTSYGTKMPRTSWDAMADLRLPLPALDEQRRIADFLDSQLSRVDAIAVKMNQQVQTVDDSVLAHARNSVAGVDTTVRRKPSGIPWTPTIPDTWGSPRVTQVARIGTGHTPSRSVPEYWVACEIPWLTTADVYRFRHDEIDSIVSTELLLSETGLANSAAVLHPAGTVALCRTAASAGYSILMEVDMATSQDFATWTCGPGLRNSYLLWCLRAMRDDLLKRLAMGSTHKTIYFPDLMSIKVPLPPLQEQDDIVAAISLNAESARATMVRLRECLTLLDKYKRSLVTAAVTGELDVATARPGVPL